MTELDNYAEFLEKETLKKLRPLSLLRLPNSRPVYVRAQLTIAFIAPRQPFLSSRRKYGRDANIGATGERVTVGAVSMYEAGQPLLCLARGLRDQSFVEIQKSGNALGQAAVQ